MEAVDRRELTIHGPSNLLAMHSVSAAVLADRSQCIVRLSIPGRSKYNIRRNMPHIFMSIILWAGGAGDASIIIILRIQKHVIIRMYDGYPHRIFIPLAVSES